MLTRPAHVAIGGGDQRDRVAEFYAELFGLSTIHEADGVLYMATRLRPAYELAVGSCTYGLDHFALECVSDDVPGWLLERVEGGCEILATTPGAGREEST